MRDAPLAIRPVKLLDMTGKKGLGIGITNEHSLTWAAARNFQAVGADRAVTYLNDKARPFVAPLATAIDAPILLPCDVARDGQLEVAFDAVTQTWERLDFVLHAVAWSPPEDLHGRLTDCTADGFAQALLVSCHSCIRTAKLAEPLMGEDGCLMPLSFLGAERVVDHYGLMGPVMTAPESSVRYLAHELGPKDIRVDAMSAGARKTRAAAGIRHADELIDEIERKSPRRSTDTTDEVGHTALLLTNDDTTAITGEVMHVDAGFHVNCMVFTEVRTRRGKLAMQAGQERTRDERNQG